jgi:hypothetical protein
LKNHYQQHTALKLISKSTRHIHTHTHTHKTHTHTDMCLCVCAQCESTRFVPVHAMKMNKSGRSLVPLILNLSARWKLMVSLTLQPHLPQGQRLSYPLSRMLDCPRASLVYLNRRKASYFCCDWNPGIVTVLMRKFVSTRSKVA